MTGPSAIGSLKGIPISIKEAPAFSSSKAYSIVFVAEDPQLLEKQ